MAAFTTMRSAPTGIAEAGRVFSAPYPSSHGAPSTPVVPVIVVELSRVCHTAEIDPETVWLAVIVNEALVELPGQTLPANQLVSPMGPAGGVTPICRP